jgi:hypothetical protein
MPYRAREQSVDFFHEVTFSKHEETPWFEGAYCVPLRVASWEETAQLVTVSGI